VLQSQGEDVAVLGLDQVRLTFKCTPETFGELLDRLEALGNEEAKQLIRQSYEMVAAKAPKVASRKEATKTRTKKPLPPPKRKNRSRTRKD